MPNRRLKQFQYSYQQDVVHAWSQITFGSTGAPTLQADPLFSGVVRNSAGDYTLTLRDKYIKLLEIQHSFIKAASAPSAPSMYIKNNSTGSSPATVEIVFNSAGTPTDPASGEVVLLHFAFRSSSVQF